MKWTTLTFKQLAQQKTLRMDPKYWIKQQATSRKRQASSSKLDKHQAVGYYRIKQKGIK